MPVPVLLLLLLLSSHLAAAPPAAQSDVAWVGAERCADCHAEAYRDWKGSHHDLAMQTVSSESVLGDFQDSRFEYNGVISRFYQRDGQFYVETDDPAGKLREYQVQYVFGYYPLQQYLLALPGGRLQALSISWDSRPREEGGQRWFHLYPDDTVPAGDPLHWTGVYQNWNLRCAECHSTNLQKNFDHSKAEYSTTWSEIDVACEACHGPGALHVKLAETGKLGAESAAGFPVELAERGMWLYPAGESIARRRTPLPHSQQVESCGRCHSRRGTTGVYSYGHDLLDTHRLSLLDDGLYHVDGQILDEVYVYGSFVQSAMYRAGVVCSNCHEPHSQALRAPGNAVCAQCHKPSRYNVESHHHHAKASAGAECVNCHMPATTYMVVDPRRDHSMRIPRPDLSAALGTPNACNQCHSDRDAEWAVNQLREWGVSFSDAGSHPARALARARSGDARSIADLQTIARDGSQSAIWRATVMVELGGFAGREAYDTAIELLQSPDPLLRMGAARSLEFLPLPQLYGVLAPHVQDPNRAVRLEVARLLAGIPLDQLKPADAERLGALFAEYLNTLGQESDMPEVQLQMGVFFTARQLFPQAEIAYRRALQLNPQFVPALLNLADLYRAQDRDDEARQPLLEATRIAPDAAAAWHALGLLDIRSGETARALPYLERAADLEQAGIRYRYVYAIALHDTGNVDGAIGQLKALLRGAPENPDLLLALVSYCKEAGRQAEAKRYAETLLELMPGNAELRQLYDSL